MRILVTGSRTWDDHEKVIIEIAQRADLARRDNQPTIVVHGACPHGADRIAADWAEWVAARGGGVTNEPHPADWDRHGRRAGPIRNAEMVAAGADVCLAFVRARSKGATHTARLALEAGIETHVWTMP